MVEPPPENSRVSPGGGGNAHLSPTLHPQNKRCKVCVSQFGIPKNTILESDNGSM